MAAIEPSVAPPTHDVPEWKRLFARAARYEDLSLLVFLGLVVGFFMVLEPSSRQTAVYWDLLRQISPYLICGVGMTLLLVAGELDLTIGSMLAFTGVVTVDVFNRADSMWIGIFAGLMTGPLVGMIIGYLVTVQRMDSLMTTLGAMFAIRGLVYVYTEKTPVVDENGFTGFTKLWSSDLGPIPVPGLIALVPIILAYVVLTQTEFGRNIYAIGGNPQAARVSGLNVQRTKFLLFVASATLAALAGLLVASQTGTGYFDAGVQGFELIVIASVVLGGVSLAGGEGRLLSAVLGVAILGMAGKGMRMMEVHITQQLVVTGILMLVAVYYHRVRKRIVIQSREWQ
ncbi:MAG: ribose transport system permease protein [Thermomicrobiales bacterium]|jgi:ribose transport system permease protein|nr:ribose transport system permease protein [Thermomicrobiales bacterium]MEA2596303.1 ribose transport system permease protein [Thermomicrobiales bacterium]